VNNAITKPCKASDADWLSSPLLRKIEILKVWMNALNLTQLKQACLIQRLEHS
jgi:hypothetical protein